MNESEQYAMAWAIKMAQDKAKQARELVAFYEKRNGDEEDADWPYARDLARNNIEYHQKAVDDFSGIAESLIKISQKV